MNNILNAYHHKKEICIAVCMFLIICTESTFSQGNHASMGYIKTNDIASVKWQAAVRNSLFKALRLEQLVQNRHSVPLNPVVLSTKNKGAYIMKKIEFNSTPERRIKVIVTIPVNKSGKLPAVVCLHGHGGTEKIVYDKSSIYKGFADVLASNGFITIAPMVSQHEVYEKDMLLMGERIFDCIRSVDFLTSLPETDTSRIGCGGLSLGGEIAMWLGAMDTRIKATVSAGFLTMMDHLEHNHCMCWKFDGLRELVDFPDIYSLVAPRALMCQNGIKEPETQFNVPLARTTFTKIQPIFSALNRPENILLDVHSGEHEVDAPALIWFFKKHLN